MKRFPNQQRGSALLVVLVVLMILLIYLVENGRTLSQLNRELIRIDQQQQQKFARHSLNPSGSPEGR
jgi:Tfp pilus assembly protein PilX